MECYTTKLHFVTVQIYLEHTYCVYNGNHILDTNHAGDESQPTAVTVTDFTSLITD